MDQDHADELRRLGESQPRHKNGGNSRARQLRQAYGRDDYPPEAILIFTQLGEETRVAVKVSSSRWRVTGRRRLLMWDGLLAAIGRGYEPSIAGEPENGPDQGYTP